MLDPSLGFSHLGVLRSKGRTKTEVLCNVNDDSHGNRRCRWQPKSGGGMAQ